MKRVAQVEVGSGVGASQEGPEEAGNLAWAVSKWWLGVGGWGGQGPGAPPSVGRGGAGKSCPRTQVRGARGQARLSWAAVVSVVMSSVPHSPLPRR